MEQSSALQISPAGDISSSQFAPKIIEKWTTPSLEGSEFNGANAVTFSENEDAASTSEVTRVQWRAGDPIDLYITRPKGVKKPRVVVYLYDYPFDTEDLLNCRFCASMANEGIATVGFATALTGQRYHDRPMKEWFVSELLESLAASAHDVQMVLSYLHDRGDFDVQRVGIHGGGSGATIAILAAAVDSRIQTLDLVMPWGSWPEWMERSNRIPAKERPNFLKPEYLARVAALDPIKWLPLLKTQTVRIRNIKDDAETPLEAQEKIAAAAPPNVRVLFYENMKAYTTAAKTEPDLGWLRLRMNSTPFAPMHATAAGASDTPSQKSSSARP